MTPTEDAEFRHQIRRLSHHPSLALIDGCNECHVIIGTPTGIYATFVLTVVMEEDMSRVLWPSCPSNGARKRRGKERYGNALFVCLAEKCAIPLLTSVIVHNTYSCASFLSA